MVRVWAPLAEKIELVIGDESYRMLSVEDGWWSTDNELPAVGHDYTFRVNDGKPSPDPRSALEPSQFFHLLRCNVGRFLICVSEKMARNDRVQTNACS